MKKQRIFIKGKKVNLPFYLTKMAGWFKILTKINNYGFKTLIKCVRNVLCITG